MNSLRVGLAASLVSFGFLGCGEKHPEASANPRKIEGQEFVVRDSLMGRMLEATGTAEPLLQADLSTKLMGKVLSVSVREGERVQQGQVLVKLDGQDLVYRSQGVASGIEAAQSQLALAELGLNRVRALYADSSAPKANLDQAQSEYQRAKSGLAQLKAQSMELRSVSEYAVLSAPFAGKVVARMADPGSMASPGQPLVRIEDASRLRVKVSTSAEAAQSLKPGMHLTGRLGGQAVEAVIEGIVPSGNGNMVVINALVANPADSLPRASVATLQLPRGQNLVRWIPVSSLVTEGDLVGVVVRTDKGDDKRWIRVGKTYGSGVEVLSGLRSGETILVPKAGA